MAYMGDSAEEMRQAIFDRGSQHPISPTLFDASIAAIAMLDGVHTATQGSSNEHVRAVKERLAGLIGHLTAAKAEYAEACIEANCYFADIGVPTEQI